MSKKIYLKIKRQDSGSGRPYWEEFELQRKSNMTVSDALAQIELKQQNAAGQRTTPVVFEHSCEKGSCGACMMLIGGQARLACRTLVDKFKGTIIIEPLSKFPVTRDLLVDRSRMFKTLEDLRAWIETDSLAGNIQKCDSQKSQENKFASCSLCGACCEACPQYGLRTKYIGAFASGHVNFFNSHPLGGNEKRTRLSLLMTTRGIGNCSNAQNCETVCPKKIPLSEAISGLNWDVMAQSIKKFFRG